MRFPAHGFCFMKTNSRAAVAGVVPLGSENGSTAETAVNDGGYNLEFEQLMRAISTMRCFAGTSKKVPIFMCHFAKSVSHQRKR